MLTLLVPGVGMGGGEEAAPGPASSENFQKLLTIGVGCLALFLLVV